MKRELKQLKEKANNLLTAITNNTHDFWDGALEDTHTSILFNKTVVDDRCDGIDDPTAPYCRLNSFEGIVKEVMELREALKTFPNWNDWAIGNDPICKPIDRKKPESSLNCQVENFTGLHGNKIANQFKIWVGDACLFQSYDSIIARRNANGSVDLDRKYWCWSKTTGKYRNIFLGEDGRATEKKIKSGEYRLVDLNS